jgi:hypothetical protein
MAGWLSCWRVGFDRRANVTSANHCDVNIAHSDRCCVTGAHDKAQSPYPHGQWITGEQAATMQRLDPDSLIEAKFAQAARFIWMQMIPIDANDTGRLSKRERVERGDTHLRAIISIAALGKGDMFFCRRGPVGGSPHWIA